ATRPPVRSTWSASLALIAAIRSPPPQRGVPRGWVQERRRPSERADRLHEPVPEPDDETHGAERTSQADDFQEHDETSMWSAGGRSGGAGGESRRRPPA